jgi:DNA-binding NarL/FixJ family response regulator
VELAGAAPADAEVTIDFEAMDTLGQPLIVVSLRSLSTSGRLSAISKRERDIAALIAQGLSNKQIARRLSITLATVKDHVHHILSKTGLSNRAAIAAALFQREIS